MDLTALGWDESWRVAFAPFDAAGLVPGRVSLEHNHVCRILTATGERLAEVGGRLKHRAAGRQELPTVGDWVALPAEVGDSRRLIRAVLPRRTWLSRKVAGRQTQEQVVASNIDTVLIVFGLDGPLKVRGIERYLVLARQSRIAPVVVLNKADACADLAGTAAMAAEIAGEAPVVIVTARHDVELPALRQYLASGRTIALLGPSGAGKSSIVNRLVGREVLPTGDVREWDARGRHTSVHRQLVVLDAGGVIIDTPGIRELQLWEADEAVDGAFGDIAELAGRCRFRDCSHDREPGCAVRAAVDAGQLDAGRYANFLKLQREQRAFEEKRDERARAEGKRQSKIVHRALRSLQKDRDRSR